MRLLRAWLACAALAGAGLGLTSLPAPVVAQVWGPEYVYDATASSVVLTPPSGARPRVLELVGPPRLLAEWVGTEGVVPRLDVHAFGPVSQVRVETLAGRTRLTFLLRGALADGVRLVPYGQGMLLALRLDGPVRPRAPRGVQRTPRPHELAPLTRITPAPVFPAMAPGYPDPYPFGAPEPGPAPVRTVPPVAQQPQPVAAASEAVAVVPPTPGPASPPPAVPQAPPTPAPAPTEPPSPTLTQTPVLVASPPTEPPLAEASPRPAFTSRLVAGLELPIAWRETFPAGRSDTSVPIGLGAGLQWDHWLTPTVGLGLGARSVGFVIDDQAVGSRFQVRHRRDDSELAASLRGRWPLGLGLEALLGSGVVVRGVTSLTTQAVVTNGVAGNAVEVDTTDWLSANWLAFGGDVRAGLGWRLLPALVWTAWGDYRVLPTGQVLTPGVSPFFPLHGWRLGTDLRYELDALELSLGWVQASDGFTGTTPDRSLSQAGGLLQLRAGWLY
ncbi:MAG: hypothetical protein VKS61_01985 [Candidatus Sericytochromatia bacterium]|nr:hypothetical protein [Candidatus Sericytochromatia bacterium]